jgi:phosphatidylserine/phosphatidylglycerophosphate/cardiolipin synthase-like enzyme
VRKLILISTLSCLSILSCTSSEKSAQEATSENRDVASIAYSADDAYFEELFSETAEQCSSVNFINCGKRKSARELTREEIQEIATTGNLNVGSKFKEAQLIVDNDVSFDKKLSAISNAKKEIRMVYFIYANDDSSALITNALIKKAQEGVRVKLLVDFITNFGNYDLFATMMKEGVDRKGNKNIDVRFYNFPAADILRDAVFTTLPCPNDDKPGAKSCYKDKKKKMESMGDTNFFSKLFLAGLYGKSATALKISIGMGAQVTKEDFAKKEGEEEIDIEKLKDFFQLLYEAQVKGNFFAKVKLQFAMIAYGSQLNPLVNQLTGRLPIIKEQSLITKIFSSKPSHSDLWDHLTDYVHHKLIVVDGREFQLGGRNIEDSYHMKSRVSGKGKYIFKDTDFHAVTEAGGAKSIEASFDRMFNFEEMVAKADRVEKYIPFKYIANSNQLGYAAMQCGEKIAKGLVKESAMDKCILKGAEQVPGYANDEARFAAVKSGLEAAVTNYNDKYLANKSYRDSWKKNSKTTKFSDNLSEKDLNTAEIYYLENTPYDVKAKNLVRRIGAKFKRDESYNKNIHQLWYKELENACRLSQEQESEVRVVFHNAYLMMPSGLMYTMAKMMNGTFGDCSNVRVTFLTNSFETTDLNVVNIFSRYQMIQLFRYYSGMKNYEKTLWSSPRALKKHKGWNPKLEYFEYKASSMGTGISLHTKLAVFGNDVFVGSANLDVRSYFMDTNNGVLVRNAQDLKNDYLKYVDSIISDKSQAQELTAHFASYTEERALQENEAILKAMLARWDKKGRINEAKKQVILKSIDNLGTRISGATFKILTYRGGEDYADMFNENEKLDSESKKGLRRISNEFNDLFKVL